MACNDRLDDQPGKLKAIRKERERRAKDEEEGEGDDGSSSSDRTAHSVPTNSSMSGVNPPPAPPPPPPPPPLSSLYLLDRSQTRENAVSLFLAHAGMLKDSADPVHGSRKDHYFTTLCETFPHPSYSFSRIWNIL